MLSDILFEFRKDFEEYKNLVTSVTELKSTEDYDFSKECEIRTRKMVEKEFAIYEKINNYVEKESSIFKKNKKGDI